MLFIIKLYARNNVKICQFWGWEFMSLSQKYEERVHKSSFIARHHFKAELSRYISLSLVNICVVVITTATVAVTWCSGHHYCIISLNKAWTKALCRFKSCSRRVGDSRWWKSLTMVPARNKAKRLSSVNHTTKTIHQFITY